MTEGQCHPSLKKCASAWMHKQFTTYKEFATLDTRHMHSAHPDVRWKMKAMFLLRLATAAIGIAMLVAFITATSRAENPNTTMTVQESIRQAIQDKDIEEIKRQVDSIRIEDNKIRSELEMRVALLEADRNTAKGFIVGFSALNIVTFLMQIVISFSKRSPQYMPRPNGRFREDDQVV